jgi:hypothetical protein
MGRFALLRPIDIYYQAPYHLASIINSKYQRRLPAPGSFRPENSGSGGKSAEHTRKIPAGVMGSFGMSRPFPRVPHVPLSNYNQIKDRAIVARCHKRV